MPEAPPVTSATLPCSRPAIATSFAVDDAEPSGGVFCLRRMVDHLAHDVG
jgi:hypothetical protein